MAAARLVPDPWTRSVTDHVVVGDRVLLDISFRAARARLPMLASQLLAKYSIRTLLGTLAWWHAMRTAAARSISDLLLR